MSGFSYRKNIDGSKNSPVIMYGLGKNSVAFQIGDLVRINTSGVVDVVDAGETIVGVVAQVVDKDGKALSPDSGYTDVYTMPSANQTTASQKYQVGYIPALPHYLFFNDADGTLAITNEFQYFDTNDENDVATAGATDTYSKQVQLISRDPDGDADASKGLFRIVETMWGTIATTRAA